MDARAHNTRDGPLCCRSLKIISRVHPLEYRIIAIADTQLTDDWIKILFVLTQRFRVALGCMEEASRQFRMVFIRCGGSLKKKRQRPSFAKGFSLLWPP